MHSNLQAMINDDPNNFFPELSNYAFYATFKFVDRSFENQLWALPTVPTTAKPNLSQLDVIWLSLLSPNSLKRWNQESLPLPPLQVGQLKDITGAE